MESTIIKMTVQSKKEIISGYTEPEKKIATEIQFYIPYGSVPYYQLSGGTTLTLNTVNKDAADIFELGKSYDVVISKSDAQ